MAPCRAGVVLLLALVVASCSGSDGDDASPSRTSTTRKPRPATTSTSTTTTAPPTTTTSPAQAVAAGKCPVVPARARPDPDRPRYVVRVDARPSEGVVEGELTVRFTPDLPTDRLVFRLWPNGPKQMAAGIRLEPGEVSAGAHRLATERPDPTVLVARLPSPLRAGEDIMVSLPWRLTVAGPVPDRVSRDGDALRLGSFIPLLAWEPGVGWALEPPVSGFAESTTSPTAHFAMSVTVPPGYTVLATGVPDGKGRWLAGAVRDIGMSVARFQTATAVAHAPHEVKVTIGVDPSIGVSPQVYVDKVVRVLQDFAARYGPYPWPAYTLGITPGLRGGIEFPMHVMQGSGTIGRTTSHEIGHMWFYGLVGNNQGRDPWLDEALATWAEGQFEGTLGAFRARDIPAAGRGRVGEPMTYWERNQSAYYRSVYVQGANAIGSLGTANLVDCALAHYVARNANRITRPADLFRALTLIFPDAVQRMAPYGIRP